MVRNQPLKKYEQPPQSAIKWLQDEVGGFPRLAIIIEALLQTPRPTSPNESIGVGFIRNDFTKLHDREPQAIIETILAKYSDFFISCPHSDPKAFVGKVAKWYLGAGTVAYGKPKLRSERKISALA